MEEYDPLVGDDDDDDIQNRIEDVAFLEKMDLADGPAFENYERELAQGWIFFKRSGEEQLVRLGQSDSYRYIRHLKQKCKELKQAAEDAARNAYVCRRTSGLHTRLCLR